MSTLSLQSVRSYPSLNPATVDLSSYVTLIYGQNGAGKSTISGYFYRNGNEEYDQCSLTPPLNMQYLVFSQEYVDDMFSRPYQPGVFSLGEDNLTTRREIDELEIKLKGLFKRKESCLAALLKNDADFKLNRDECITTVYSVAAEIRNLPALWDLMKGSKQSERLFDEILSHNATENTSSEILHRELQQLEASQQSSVSEMPDLPDCPLNAGDILILSTAVAISTTSPLSDLIKQLGNLTWVQEGEKWVQNDCCPFCQSKIDARELSNSIRALFDESWNDAIMMSKKISTSYQDWLSRLSAIAEIADKHPMTNEWPELKADLEKLIRIASENSNMISEKCVSPSSIITLQNETSSITAVQDGISKYNERIRERNRKSADYRREKELLSRRLRSHIRALASESIQNYHEVCDELRLARKPYEVEEQNLAHEMHALEETIRLKTGEIAGTTQAALRINDNLEALGIRGFSIEPYSDLTDQYCLKRSGNHSASTVFSRLSEGEKTIIAFLYFLETCLGHSTREGSSAASKLIVIDDPVSSLSQNYIFEIAGLIQQRLITPKIAGKIVILTHNLFFFQEMLLSSGKNNAAEHPADWKLLRIVKNEFSSVLPVSGKALMNDYQALWYVLKTSKDHDAASVIIPNTMRQILEYYFSFSGKNDRLYKALETLTNGKNEPGMRAFTRYINRHSHADARNIRQLETADVGRYLKWFARVFEEAQDKEHYDRMMEGREE